jgi:hypothetical protein
MRTMERWVCLFILVLQQSRGLKTRYGRTTPTPQRTADPRLGPEEPDALEAVGEAGVCVPAAPGAGTDAEGSVIEAVDPPELDGVTEMLAVPVTARVPPP